ncbi:hypothetical protein POTOM_006421 [Populus tomentosa]|uniref:Uncharacterized protein n=1 Tax=Populus tomentosa TaxID=118781 RepID=A0A8X8AIX1_POPTO|nr:hypothetical protein POTOM_006421 [Populus tomentosa]
MQTQPSGRKRRDKNRLSSRNNLLETKAQQVARFVGGLRWAIQDRVAMQTMYTLTKAVALVIKAETQLDKSKAMSRTRNQFDNNRATINKGNTSMTPLTSTTQPSFSNTIQGTSRSGAPIKPANTIPPEVTPRNPYARPDSINVIDVDSQNTVLTSVQEGVP